MQKRILSTAAIGLMAFLSTAAHAADGTITITDHSGFTRTIRTSATTTYEKDGVAAKASDITVGALVRAVGEVDADGTTLDATKVSVGKPAHP